MNLEKIADKVVETDVLVIGGGIAGCPAAAKAAEHGLHVTLAEKAKTDRSGSAAAGIDHFPGFFRRGLTPKEFAEVCEGYGPGAFFGGYVYSDRTRLFRAYAAGEWGVEELEKLGVTMRWDGELRWMDAEQHWKGPTLRVHWQNVKPEMAAGVRKRGVNVLERTMIIDLLTNNGNISGATAVNTRTGEFILIIAKAVVIATADCSRIYDHETPMPWKFKFRYHTCPSSVCGDGWAMAYRAGAEVANMEQSGGGYRFRDDLALSYGNIGNEGFEGRTITWDGVEQPSYGIMDRVKLEQMGKEPLYVTLEDLPDDFKKRIEVAYVDERMVSFKVSEDRGFDFRTHRFELMGNRPFQLKHAPGINANADLMTTINGLYAIGDCVQGSHAVASATTMGFLVGDTVGEFVKTMNEPVIDEAQVESHKELIETLKAVKDGTEPLELESAIRYANHRYIGLLRSEGKLNEGLRRLSSLKREFLLNLQADNPHHLMRALEVRNIMEVSLLHIQASLERTETRSEFIRLDHPEENPEWDGKLSYQMLEDGKAVFKMRERPELDMDYKEER
ncbi:FAD-dependent oxidoreductase [Thermodesulfobacteriota bacterium]